MRRPSLQKRFEDSLTALGSDPALGADLIAMLRERGVVFDASGRDHCRCFPRTKEPKRMARGHYVCRCCKLRLDDGHETRVARELGLIDRPA